MIKRDNVYSRALKSDVGKSMFTSVPTLVLFIIVILLIQGTLFFLFESQEKGYIPLILSFSYALVCLPLFFYIRKNQEFYHFSLLNFLILIIFYLFELQFIVFWNIFYVWILLLLIQILSGYFLLSNRFFYVLTGINLLFYGSYFFIYVKNNFQLDTVLAITATFLLSLLFQKDRRKTLITLSEMYNSQKEINHRFKQLEDNISHIFILASVDFKRFYHISSTFDRLVRFSRNDLIRDPDIWLNDVYSGDRLRVEMEMDAAARNPVHKEFEFRFEGRDKQHWLRYQIFPIKDDRTEKITRQAIIVEDITDTKDAELKLAEARSLDGELAARIQRNLLFSSSDLTISDLDLSAESIPSLDVGGDYFDLYRYSDKVLDLIIADVMGKGMIASLLGAASKSAFMKSRLDLTVKNKVIPEIDQIVSMTNKSISGELIQMGKFITLQYGRLDMDKQLFSFIDNGHTSILYYSERTQCCWSLKGWNMPLGFNPEEEEVTSIIPFNEGDLFFLYSDGIIEAENEEGEQFGEKRLTYVITNSRDLTSSQIINKIRNLIFHYSSSESFADDVTSIALKIGSLQSDIKPVDAVFEGKRESLQVLRTFVTAFLMDHCKNISSDLSDLIILAINEAFANVVEHNYEKFQDRKGREIYVEAESRGDYICFRLFWDGEDFEWSEVRAPDLSEMKGGGYGVSLMRSIMDSISYSSNINGVQQLCLVKKIND